MPSIPASGFKTLVALAFIVAVLGGIWRGIGSCGGYAWHGQAMLVTLSIAALSLVLFTPRPGSSLLRRVLLGIAVIGTFFVIRALAAPFYPSFPGIGGYFRQVGMALLYGPC